MADAVYMREYMRRKRAGLGTRGLKRRLQSEKEPLDTIGPVKRKRQAEKAPGWGAHAESHPEPPEHVLADAEFRNALPDLMFGDPKPGQSALDKRAK